MSYLLCLLLYFVIIISYGLMHLVKWLESRSVMSDSLWPHRLYSPWNSPGQNSGVGSPSFLQEIFSTQRSNPGLLHCRWILYQLSHKGSPRILDWVGYPFSNGSFWPRTQTGSPALQADSLPTELSGKQEKKMMRSWEPTAAKPRIWVVFKAFLGLELTVNHSMEG